ncbi:glycosyltransferase family 2 protein, partial [Thioclava sp. BHET1]
MVKMRLVLAIATTGRAAVLRQTIAEIARQSRKPDLMVVSVSGPEDLYESALTGLGWPCLIVTGSKGLCRQRNRILKT